MQDKYIDYIKKAVDEVFTTMISLDPIPGKPIPIKNGCMLPGKKITGIIGIAGSITASIILHFEKSIALKATSNMVGVDYTEVDADVRDTVGEITNMVAGAAKSEFLDSGIDLTLSLPIVINGSNYETNSLNGDNAVLIPFKIDDTKLYIELSIKE